MNNWGGGRDSATAGGAALCWRSRDGRVCIYAGGGVNKIFDISGKKMDLSNRRSYFLSLSLSQAGRNISHTHTVYYLQKG